MVSGNWLSKYEPTSSQVSAPSYLPIVTSNESREFFFAQGLPLSKRRDCFAWNMISFSSAVISVNASANFNALLSRSCEMEG